MRTNAVVRDTITTPTVYSIPLFPYSSPSVPFPPPSSRVNDVESIFVKIVSKDPPLSMSPNSSMCNRCHNAPRSPWWSTKSASLNWSCSASNATEATSPRSSTTFTSSMLTSGDRRVMSYQRASAAKFARCNRAQAVGVYIPRRVQKPETIKISPLSWRLSFGPDGYAVGAAGRSPSADRTVETSHMHVHGVFDCVQRFWSYWVGEKLFNPFVVWLNGKNNSIWILPMHDLNLSDRWLPVIVLHAMTRLTMLPPSSFVKNCYKWIKNHWYSVVYFRVFYRPSVSCLRP